MQTFDLKANQQQVFRAFPKKDDGSDGTVTQGDIAWDSSHPEIADIHSTGPGGAFAYIYPAKPPNLGATLITATGPAFATSFALNIVAADPDPNAATHYEFTADAPQPLP